MPSTFATITVTYQSTSAILTLNRPDKRNALSTQMMEEILKALEQEATGDYECLILTGAGKSFCAGLDLEQLQTLSGKQLAGHREDSSRVARLMRTLFDFPLPTIAAVNGAAMAGGMGLATICDFTLAVPEAKFGYTEVRIGFLPAIVSSFLVAQVGDKRARDLLFTGRIVSAEEALKLGLVSEIVEAPNLMDRAHALAAALAINSPESLRATKRLLSSYARRRLEEELAEAVEQNAQTRMLPDFREGIAAFLEKREARWPSRKQSSEKANS